MVEIKIVNVDDPSPRATGAYVQVITRIEHEADPGNIVSDIEHFSLDDDGIQKSMSRETRNIGFNEAVETARAYAETHDVPFVYATDRTAKEVSEG